MKLCAIAKNEGPYIPDWIHHHLYYGFDAIEVWVNGSDDSSLKILRRIGKRHPDVSVRKVDRLLEVAHRRGKGFQELAFNNSNKRPGGKDSPTQPSSTLTSTGCLGIPRPRSRPSFPTDPR